jgi:hypothetical protein
LYFSAKFSPWQCIQAVNGLPTLTRELCWVKTKDGAYWWLKRGTLKKAKVNAAYSESIEWMKVSPPAAKRIM